jgi:glycosyltransferase involved in cell wall biosynthesis
MPNLMHVVSMQQPAGVEAHFAEFAACAVARHAGWTQSWLNPASTLHPFFRERVVPVLSHTVHAKYRWGIKLPSRPASLRAWHYRRSFEETRPDVMMIWNRTAKLNPLVDAAGEERCVHWEHGSAWDVGKEVDRARYLRRIPVAIANSRASARFLRIHWDYAGDIHVCRNALRPSLLPSAPMRKAYPLDGPWRLGVAARLFPVKGVALAVHALAALRRRGVDAELHVAGAGPERDALQALAAQLGIGSVVRFRGAVRDMHSFYRDIHCLVHAPLTEAFGLVAIEAAAHGAPVIAANVDGLPEAVADGVTGFTVAPSLPVEEYDALGGGLAGLPALVYDPVNDSLRPPQAVDPADLGAAVERLFASPDAYEAISASASEHVRREYAFDAHVDDVIAVVEGVAGRGSRSVTALREVVGP